MPTVMRCPQGHHWPTDAVPGSDACPFCGARGGTVAGGDAESSLATEVTFVGTIPPPPAKPEPSLASGETFVLPGEAPAARTSEPTEALSVSDLGKPALRDEKTERIPPQRVPGSDGTVVLPEESSRSAAEPAVPGTVVSLSVEPPSSLQSGSTLPLDPTAETILPSSLPSAPSLARTMPLDVPESSTEGETFVSEVSRVPLTRPGVSAPSAPPGPAVPATVPSLSATGGARPAGLPQVPGYEVLGELGRGGMGVVYKARQVRLDRLVALKMIRSGADADKEDLERFRIEAEAVARVQHPNIVQIFEVGDYYGRPYCSLEYLPGGSLDDRLDGSPLSAPAAARVLQTLATAMHFAHERGIVHRDLKPANILLQAPDGGAPEFSWQFATLKVTDFGLAKKLDAESSQTRSGAIMGTPSYMAPEQAKGKTREVGRGADVYSLGAILYELLTGRPPFKGETVLDTLQQVQVDDPVPPSRLLPKTPRDLETICLKCLEKDPERRYLTAGELAEDLRRFQEHEPILARPTPVWERARKWAWRRPAAAALVALSAVGLVAVLSGSLLFANYERRRADTEAGLKQVAEKNEKEARAQYQRAEANFRSARAAVDDLLTRVGQKDLAGEPRMEKVRRELLGRALAYYQRFLDEKMDDPVVRYETGLAYQRVGTIQDLLGQYRDSLAAYGQAADILEGLGREYPDRPEYAQSLADTFNNTALVLAGQGKRAEADAANDKAVAIKEKLAESFAAEAGHQLELALALNLRGAQAHRPLDQRRASFERALNLITGLVEKWPTNDRYQREDARVRANLAALLTQGHPQEAAGYYRQALARLQALVEQVPEEPEHPKLLGMTYANLGIFHELQRQPAEAEKVYLEGARLFTDMAKKFPRTPDYRQELGRANDNLGKLYEAVNNRPRAEQSWEAARAVRKQLAQEFPQVAVYRREYAASLFDWGSYLGEAQQPAAAKTALLEAQTLQQELVEAEPAEPLYQLDLARTLANLGQLEGELRYQEAEEYYQKAIGLLEKMTTLEPTAPTPVEELALAHAGLANLLERQGSLADAVNHQRRQIALLEKLATLTGDSDKVAPRLAETLGELAQLLVKRRRPAEAAAEFARAIPKQKSLWEGPPRRDEHLPRLLGYLWSRADLLLQAEDHAAGLQALADLAALTPPEWPDYNRAAGLAGRGMILAEADPKLTAAQRQQAQTRYGAQAMALLRKARARGDKELEYLKTAPELRLVRTLPEFKTLLEEMEKNPGK